MNRLFAILSLALWSAFSRPARTALLIATLGGGASGVALSAAVLDGYARELEALSFGAYARSLIIQENAIIQDRFGPPRRADLDDIRAALEGQIEAEIAWRSTISDVRAGAVQATLTVYGVAGDYAREADMPILAGRGLSLAETRGAQRRCIVGLGANEALFGDGYGVGQRIQINGVSCEVIGVSGDPNSRTAERFRTAIIAPFVTTARYFETPDGLSFLGPDEVERLTIVLRAGVDRNAALIDADKALRRAHGAPVAAVAPFTYADPQAPTRSLARQRDLVARLLLAIATIAALVAATGYAAAAIASVDMRRRDIALQMMSGATGRSILAQVLVEGLVFATIGAVASLSVLAVAGLAAQRFIAFPFELNIQVVTLTLGGALIIGLLASLWPARRAAAGSPALQSKA